MILCCGCVIQKDGSEWGIVTPCTYHNPAAILAERDEAREAIAWANNSLFGSHAFFLSTRGDLPNNPHHLDTAIEALKADARLKHQAEAERDTLLAIVRAADAMRTHARPCRCHTCGRPECDDPRAYDAARAAWKGKE